MLRYLAYLVRHRDLEHALCQIHSYLSSLHEDSSFGLAFRALRLTWQSAATPEGESIPSLAAYARFAHFDHHGSRSRAATATLNVYLTAPELAAGVSSVVRGRRRSDSRSREVRKGSGGPHSSWDSWEAT
jgi:hypothetical protein